jgi:hypothetical protein
MQRRRAGSSRSGGRRERALRLVPLRAHCGAPWEPDFLPSWDDDDTPVCKSCGAEGLLVTILVPFPVPASGGRG